MTLSPRDSSIAPGRRIISIASAPGWGALIEKPDSVGEPQLVTLAVWALVEEPGGDTRIVGLVQMPAGEDSNPGSFAPADEIEGFAGYTNQGLKTKPAE